MVVMVVAVGGVLVVGWAGLFEVGVLLAHKWCFCHHARACARATSPPPPVQMFARPAGQWSFFGPAGLRRDGGRRPCSGGVRVGCGWGGVGWNEVLVMCGVSSLVVGDSSRQRLLRTEKRGFLLCWRGIVSVATGRRGK